MSGEYNLVIVETKEALSFEKRPCTVLCIMKILHRVGHYIKQKSVNFQFSRCVIAQKTVSDC